MTSLLMEPHPNLSRFNLIHSKLSPLYSRINFIILSIHKISKIKGNKSGNTPASPYLPKIMLLITYFKDYTILVSTYINPFRQ